MSARGMTQLGALLIVVSLAGIIFGFGPARFADRLAGRVDAVGTVQWGVSQEAGSPDDRLPSGANGIWKVDYEIDGSAHTGLILGEYREGQQVLISAPADGSIYALLHEGTPAAVKVLSWILVPLSLLTLGAGLWYGVRGIRQRDRSTQAEAREQLTLRYPHLFPPPAGPSPAAPPGGTPGPSAAQPDWVPPTDGDPRPPVGRGTTDFFAPYDI